jgi:hypothetical protein
MNKMGNGGHVFAACIVSLKDTAITIVEGKETLVKKNTNSRYENLNVETISVFTLLFTKEFGFFHPVQS